MFAKGVAATVVAFAVDGARVNRGKASPLSSCGVKGASAPSGQIVNGDDATECAWRWQASLQKSGRPFCGGTLVTPEWVLTAAHCVSKPDFDVTFGDYNTSARSSRQQKRSAAEVYQHPSYTSRPTRWDYALVKLDSPVEINECVGTACLPEENIPAGSKCWITGWGTLQAGGSTPQILQEAEVDIISNEDCVTKFGYSGSLIDESMICAQGRSADGKIRDACQGDSGGPLVCESNGKWSVYGATSWGRGCAGANYPGVWARVSEVNDWVDAVLSGNAPTKPPVCPWYCGARTCLTAACKENCPFCEE